MTKRIVTAVSILMLLGALLGLVAACGGDDGLPNDAVARVGDVYITQEELDGRIADFQAQYGGMLPNEETNPEAYQEFIRDVVDYLVTYEIVSQRSGQLGISVTDEEVQGEIDKILEQSFGGDQEAFDNALAAQNMTMDQLERDYKESMLLQRAYEEVTKDVTTVPDADIEAYYEQAQASYFVDETRTVRHILISPGKDSAEATTSTTAAPTDADWEQAKSEAETLRAELANGGDWMTIAAEHSDDTGTKDVGGELGLVNKGEMVAEFEESVFSLAKDEISQPVRTVFGYHVIQVTGINEAKQYSLEEVREDISANLVNDAKTEAWQAWISNTRAELGVEYKSGLERETTPTTEASTDATEAGSSITTAPPETTTSTSP